MFYSFAPSLKFQLTVKKSLHWYAQSFPKVPNVIRVLQMLIVMHEFVQNKTP